MRGWRYQIYLQVGSMSDILNMSMNDFRGVVDEYAHENTPLNKRFRKQTQSQKGMITRLKELKKNKK